MGHGSARIARAVGASTPAIRAIVNGRTQTVTLRLRDAVTAIYDVWWDKQPVQATRGQTAAATAARRRAITGHWCPPAAVDDDELDSPGYQPAHGWRPAIGTGTARDITIRSPRYQNRNQRPGIRSSSPAARLRCAQPRELTPRPAAVLDSGGARPRVPRATTSRMSMGSPAPPSPHRA